MRGISWGHSSDPKVRLPREVCPLSVIEVDVFEI
ncbi:MAG: hypothetical protein A4E52_01973 [Pelotomaculum sp. PtaB.Bin013]|nr:MAG: hypothetical protein A4E52_01973 [Pelotomaculum sp. PtaB.Bin013]